MNPPESKAPGNAIALDMSGVASAPNPGAPENSAKGLKRKEAAMAVSWGIGPTPFILTVHILGVAAAILVLIWSISYRGGLNWNAVNKNLVFNIHPVLMVIGFIFVSSEAILVYKSVPGSKVYRKGVHLSLQAVALGLGIFGICAAFKYHNESKIDNLYSLHSWLGLGTIILFAIQWIAGFVTFWYPGAAANTRRSVLPWHVFLGIFIYVLAIASAQTGVLEKVTFLQTSKVFGHYDNEAYIANFTALVVLLLGVFTVLGAVIPTVSAEEEYRALE
ncbi:probable ascorbate-specific transmembrane electron transporter 2 [Selaginella moellendorffii]|nr:probable ascorbate-specific transmembrane electron transporter 2 [Selaginella moellendorffii]XP_024542409.1 probable ascorbate-specific transmembrane electron transporter 2 [Selaginella moellendorffii]XP_024542410.1 probable ascorbate-specific transmembrane electron transporter 2 [Selaginella moellendorffii]|eukprot:XP_002981734.2 probable ascorbate-specific transmembrane electron transporter 2 [Selaginella moellendorffii]